MTEASTILEKLTNTLFLMMRPIEAILERTAIIKPKLIATCDFVETCGGEEGEDDFDETITFYFLEYPSGKREWRVHEYGLCAENFAHESYLKDVLAWSYGGPLPREAKKVGPATVLEMIKTEAAE